jgi:hypothetical protein
MFAIGLLSESYCATLNQIVNIFFVAQKRKSKLGRPKLPPGAAKAYVLRTRISIAELNRFEAAAAKSGDSLPKWVRKTLIDAT